MDATRFPDALGMGLVSLNSIACLVRFRSLDFVPGHRHSRAESGYEFRVIGRASRRRSSGRRCLARLGKTEGRTSIARMTKSK